MTEQGNSVGVHEPPPSKGPHPAKLRRQEGQPSHVLGIMRYRGQNSDLERASHGYYYWSFLHKPGDSYFYLDLRMPRDSVHPSSQCFTDSTTDT